MNPPQSQGRPSHFPKEHSISPQSGHPLSPPSDKACPNPPSPVQRELTTLHTDDSPPPSLPPHLPTANPNVRCGSVEPKCDGQHCSCTPHLPSCIACRSVACHCPTHHSSDVSAPSLGWCANQATHGYTSALCLALRSLLQIPYRWPRPSGLPTQTPTQPCDRCSPRLADCQNDDAATHVRSHTKADISTSHVVARPNSACRD